MSEFKVGDKAIINTNYPDNHYKRVNKGEIGIVINPNREGLVQVKFDKYVEEVWPFRLDLYVDEKESTAKWLRENPWFIRTGSPEKSKIAQEWLFEHGMQWAFTSTIKNNINEKLLTNTYDSGEKNSYIMFSINPDKTNAQEIKIEFETIIKNVQLPEITPKKTEQQLRIEELEATIAQASAQIKQLKEGV